ncbi:hypothetical protein CaCOL14_001470 [Colletotrichum acutatum]
MSPFAALEDFIFSDRGGIIENVHRIHAVVTDACGSLLYAVGDPSRLTLARSAAKPAQILALLEIEGFEPFAFDDKEIALMCSSHSSEARHVQSGVTMLAKIAAKEQDLQCGGHPSMSESVNNEWIRRVPALPFRDISHIYALLAHAADAEAQDPTTDLRTRHLARIYHPMWRFSEVVAGDARFCTELMLKHGGNLVGKLGADGCYGVAIRDSEKTRRLGVNSGLGISVKVEDGNEEILYAVVMEILEQLGIGSAESRAGMEALHHIERVNTAGVITGKVSFSFKLRKP